MTLRERRFHARLECELALAEQVGAALLMGVPPMPLLRGVACSAAEIWMHTGQSRMRTVRKDLRHEFAVPLQACVQDGEGLPVCDQPCTLALITELPPQHPEDALERALSIVADEGTVLLLVPARSAGADARLRRLLEAACGGESRALPDAPEGMLALSGRRRCAVLLEGAAPQPELPVSCLVTTQGAEEDLESTLVDLALRQHYRPQEIFVLDLGGERVLKLEASELVARSAVPIAVFPKHGSTAAAALQDALGGVQGRFVHCCHAGARMAPHALTTLGMRLENSEASAFVMGSSAVSASDGWLRDEQWQLEPKDRRLCAARRFPVEAVLWRTDALRRAGGFDETLAPYSARNAALRLAASAGWVECDAVVAGHRSVSAAPQAEVPWRALLELALTLTTDPRSRTLLELRLSRAQAVLDHARTATDADILLNAQALQQLGRSAAALPLLAPLVARGLSSAAALSFAMHAGGEADREFARLVEALRCEGAEYAAWLISAEAPPAC